MVASLLYWAVTVAVVHSLPSLLYWAAVVVVASLLPH